MGEPLGAAQDHRAEIDPPSRSRNRPKIASPAHPNYALQFFKTQPNSERTRGVHEVPRPHIFTESVFPYSSTHLHKRQEKQQFTNF